MHLLTFLRHGESEANAAQVLQGQVDSPLSEAGKKQAALLGQRWRAEGVEFDHVISSPLQRAYQTAEIVVQGIGFGGEIEIDPIWIERDFGELEGRGFQELRTAEPAVDFFQPFLPIGGDGESQLDLYLRASQGLQNILRRPGGRYLIVTHGALISKLMFAVLGITPQGHKHSPIFLGGNTSYVNLGYRSERQQFVLYGFNNPDEWSGMKEG